MHRNNLKITANTFKMPKDSLERKGLNISDLKQSARNSNDSYSLMCTQLGIQNHLRHRRRIWYHYNNYLYSKDDIKNSAFISELDESCISIQDEVIEISQVKVEETLLDESHISPVKVKVLEISPIIH